MKRLSNSAAATLKKFNLARHKRNLSVDFETQLFTHVSMRRIATNAHPYALS